MICFVSVTIQTLIYMFGQMLNSVASASKVFEYLDRKPQVTTDGTLKPDWLTGHISFQHVNFAYPSCSTKTVLQVKSEIHIDMGGRCFQFKEIHIEINNDN